MDRAPTALQQSIDPPSSASQGATMRWKTSIGFLVLTFVLQGPVAPDALAAGPSDQLRVSVEQALKVLGDGTAKREHPRERRVTLRKIADDIFDWDETAKRSLGTHWQQRTPPEREEFVRLFAELLEKSYMSKIELYDGEKIAWLGDTIDGEQAIVRTKILNKQGTEIPVSYKMLRRDDRWKVYDVEIESVSLVANYRTQINNMLRRSSYPELVRTLKAKANEAEADSAMASPRTR
jgi:phospholipid transport system substrate-binding protein